MRCTAWICLGSLWLTACGAASGSDQFRRTALVPAPEAVNWARPAQGEVELAGSYSIAPAETEYSPVPGSSSLLAAQHLFTGEVRANLNSHFAIGAHGLFSHRSFATATTNETEEVDDFVWGVGAHGVFTFIDSRFVWFGAAIGLGFVNVPWATYRSRNDGGFIYEEGGADLLPRFHAELGITFRASQTWGFPIQIGLQNSIYNTSGDSLRYAGSTLKADRFGPMVSIGAIANFTSGFVLGTQFTLAMQHNQFLAGDNFVQPGIRFTIGLRFGDAPKLAPGVLEEIQHDGADDDDGSSLLIIEE